MRHVHFTKEYDYRQDDFTTIAYSAGIECEVDEDCAARAVACSAAHYCDFAEDDLIEGRISEWNDD